MKIGNGTTLIRNGQIVDGTGAASLANGAVVIEEGKLTFVGREEDAPLLSRDATVIDAHGGTIMPGLVEALSSDVLQCRGSGRPRYQVSGRVRHAAGGGEREAALECGYTPLAAAAVCSTSTSG